MKNLTLLSFLLGAIFFSGCALLHKDATPQAKIYFTLSDIKTMADAAEKVYGNQVALGHVSPESQAKIDAKITELHRAFTISLRAARMDLQATNTAALQKIADDFVLTVQSLTK